MSGSLADFQKIQAYAWLYASLHKVPTQQLTVTIVESGYPQNVIRHLVRDLACDVEEGGPGLYVVKGMTIPVQIIESEKLNKWENMWLKNLRKDADAESFAEMLRAVEDRKKGAHLKAYLNVLLTANPKVLKEVGKTMLTPELREVLIDIGWAAEFEKKAREETRREDHVKITKNLLARGVDPVIIAESTGLTLDEIRHIAG